MTLERSLPMSIDVEAVRRAMQVAVSKEVSDLNERLDWADRDPTLEEAMCFTDREAAYILNVSPRSIGRYVKRGDLHAIYLTPPHRTRRFLLPDIKAFIRKGIRDSR
jgi:uncharacterized protein (UPF0212 family)